MNFTPLVQKAIDMSARLHNGQNRKNDETLPYVSHCFSVACILSQYTGKPEVIAAGLLHDVLEDVKGYTYYDLLRDFGPEVANLVKAVSEDKDPNAKTDKRASWMKRKKGYLENLQKHGSGAMLICAADKINNLRSVTAWYLETGEKTWEKFNSSVKNQIWYYQEVLRILKIGLRGNTIISSLEKEIERFLDVLLKSKSI
ncbi:MAG TPA: HD domain-containing protein [Candidatus Magasanikbacteria bacterium]|nr:HD domain-containing protein [Candidatus Magasanikbacteria bacterium]